MREQASLFKAFGDETRLRMLWLLMNEAELCVCDFMAVLGTTQSKASRHLRNLFHAGLVNDRREGLWMYYSLREPDSEFVRTQLETLQQTLALTNDARPLLQALRAQLVSKQQKTACG